MVLHRFFFLLCIIGFGVFTNLHSITAQTNSPKTNSFYNGSTTNRFRLRVEEFLSKGELDSALMYIHREMTTTNNDTLQMDASWHLGRIFGRKGETTRMFEYFFQALDRAEKSNNLSKIALYCNAIGSMYANITYTITRKNFCNALNILQKPWATRICWHRQKPN